MKLITVTQLVEGEDADGEYQQQETPTVVNAEFIRCFYPRKGGNPGTRITFADGHGFAVKEEFADVQRVCGMQNARPAAVEEGVPA